MIDSRVLRRIVGALGQLEQDMEGGSRGGMAQAPRLTPQSSPLLLDI